MKILTPTSGRPKAFKQLCKYVEAQTFDHKQWIVVTDDYEDYKFPRGAKVIKRDASADTLPSLCHNMLAALEHVEDGDRVAILEDDDWYAPNYLYELNKMLDKAELAGFHEDAYYYVLSRRAKRWHNQSHASFAATGFRHTVVPYLKEICTRGDIYLDMLLWKECPVTKLLTHNFTGIPQTSREQPKMKDGFILNEKPRHVGLKENWHGGKAGLSALGHEANGGYDQTGEVCKKWLGDDANFYLNFTRYWRIGEEMPPQGVILSMPMASVDG